ncbi:MAG: putative sensor domain DACNV-containing protein [Mucilaginibacter sp.]
MSIQTESSSAYPTYKAARKVSAAIEHHFMHQLAAAADQGEKNLAPEPSRQIIETIIDTTFWASLRREEGHSPKISLAFLPPESASKPLLFEYPLSLTAEILNKLSPAVERPGIHLGVWQRDGELYIWGTTQDIPGFCFVLEVVEPGLLVIKHRRIDGFGKFVNVAVLQGDSIKIVDDKSRWMPDCPDILHTLLGFATEAWGKSVKLHVQLAVSMRAHGRGGILLVVPSAHDKWRESIIQPVSYPVMPAFRGLSELMVREVEEHNLPAWQDDLEEEIEGIAGLTAVDGATIINDKHEVLAFGAKITRSPGRESVKKMLLTEPTVDAKPLTISPSTYGGTRHFSAAQFVYDQRDAFALVASQDGRFTIFTWSPCDEIVLAHRVECLLI